MRRDAYQASTGSLLLTVPRDVTADWARAAREIAAVVGPLWASQSAYRKAFESSLTPSQRAYVDGERTEALRLLGVRFGRLVLAGEQR
ncbi:hypothetical protein [Streptomyces sp. RKAG337]|uniref:hypothetical protein n=1 Tax=Streptomyces sp. RKAG337 TaxID=2893404 RepID=UPI00203405F0|nr:hypothetical protein [Streptomyces sp. RKAG337]MCM2430929.1 hypothetical protein [Streptomyces sp. RKAG337]